MLLGLSRSSGVVRVCPYWSMKGVPSMKKVQKKKAQATRKKTTQGLHDGTTPTNTTFETPSETDSPFHRPADAGRLLNPPQIPVDPTLSQVPMMSIEDAKALLHARSATSKDSDLTELETENTAVYDTEALERHLEQLRYKCPKGVKRVPWIETLTLELHATVNAGDDVVNIGEDFRRETRLYVERGASEHVRSCVASAALTEQGVVEGLRRLTAIGLPFTRPKDFYAEMLKSDQQMLKVRSLLAAESSRVEAVEKRKKDQMAKKFAKRVQAERIKRKSQQKKENLQKIEQWKKTKFKDTL